MRLDIPDQKKLVHETTFPIRWDDLDAMQQVSNVTCFRYLEIARIDWLYAVGGAPNPNGDGPVIVNAFCNFIKPLEFPGVVLAKHYVANPGRTSFDTFITLERADLPDVIHAAGGATTVWINAREQKAAPLPDWLRTLLE